MSFLKVIIQTYPHQEAPIDLTPSYSELLALRGHSHWNSIDARIDPALIAFIESGAPSTRESWQVLEIAVVDTSRLWYISEYEDAESIKYLSYDVVRPALSYIEMK